MSGLLLANAQARDAVPQRAGGIAMADFTAGLLAAIAVLAGLLGRARDGAPGIEVSLLGAALAVQAQRFVSVEASTAPPRRARRAAPATAADLERHVEAARAADELEPYYRTYRRGTGTSCSPACTSASASRRPRSSGSTTRGPPTPRRRRPSSPSARSAARWSPSSSAGWRCEPAPTGSARFRAVGVPAAEVQRLDQLFEHEQVAANGLVQTVDRAASAR